MWVCEGANDPSTPTAEAQRASQGTTAWHPHPTAAHLIDAHVLQQGAALGKHRLPDIVGHLALCRRWRCSRRGAGAAAADDDARPVVSCRRCHIDIPIDVLIDGVLSTVYSSQQEAPSAVRQKESPSKDGIPDE